MIRATIAQDAYQKALPALANLPTTGSLEFDYAAATPHAFAQAWVRCLRDIAGELTILAKDPATSEAARAAASAFVDAFPGVGLQTGPMRVMIVEADQVYFANGPARYFVQIDDGAVRRTIKGSLQSGRKPLTDNMFYEADFV